MADSKQLWFHTRLSGKVYPEQCCWVGCLRLVCAGEGRGGVLFVDARAPNVVFMYSPHASFIFWQGGTRTGTEMHLRAILCFCPALVASFDASSLRGPLGASTQRKVAVDIAPRMAATPQYKEQRGNLAELDAEAMLAAQSFPISADDLVAKAKSFIASDYGADDTEVLAGDFLFVGPFVGPLTREACAQLGFNPPEPTGRPPLNS